MSTSPADAPRPATGDPAHDPANDDSAVTATITAVGPDATPDTSADAPAAGDATTETISAVEPAPSHGEPAVEPDPAPAVVEPDPVPVSAVGPDPASAVGPVPVSGPEALAPAVEPDPAPAAVEPDPVPAAVEPGPEPVPGPEAEAPATPPGPVPVTTPDVPPGSALDTPARAAQGRLGIDGVTPEVEGGRFPSKAVVGEIVPVGAAVWREGHDAVAATLVWERLDGDAGDGSEGPGPDAARARMVPVGAGTDRVAGSFVPDAEGPWTFRVDAWSDPWTTWRHAVEVKAAAGQGAAELANDLETGARLLERGASGIEDRVAASAEGAAGRTGPIPTPPVLTLATACRKAAAGLRDTDAPLPERLAGALSEPVHRTMTEHPVRELVTRGRPHRVNVERAIALAGSWYEFFPRSTGGRDADGTPVHGTFATATRELDRVAAMGFDVAYLPPIHPVGTVNRKGPNNTLTPGPDDVGSPWAIGSAEGGHDAVDPNLGTIEDFDAFVARAHELGLEVALDLALQCAPDHPWAAAHPEWFVVRPDGTIAYAENPPKKYQDIYPVNFDTDPEGIYAEVLRVVQYWVDHGVRVFRVDNPHTKPPDFWAWLIAEVQRRDPGVVFLAEAFTRPARLLGLARLGFSQSYTYFTWRTGKQELREFFEMHRDRIDECRPNCFVNTPDILHESLQRGGPGMFALRAALAATLSPTWGVYSGFELFEHQPVREGSEEYLDSEKYELRPRDFAGALASGRSLEPWLARLNALRRAHPALRQIRTLRFHEIDNDALLAFSKTDPRSGDAVICVITLNPFAPEDGTLRLDLTALGLEPGERFTAVDEVSGQVFDWGQANYVRLEPWRDVAHVVAVRRR